MIHPESLVNFIAAYAFDGDVAKAQVIMGLADGSIDEADAAAMGYTGSQAMAFMYNEAGAPTGASAFNLIDTWIGGLAEAHVPGGLLGSTFDLVFTVQIESLMDGDRFYYLQRLFGQQFGEEVNNGQFKDIVERNTGLTHLNGSVLSYADKYYDFSAQDSNANVNSHKTEHKYAEMLAANPTLGIWSDGSAAATGINNNGTLITVGGVTYIRDFRPDLAPDASHPVEGTPTSGADSHEVMIGTNRADFVHMRSGDDTFYGEEGNDKIYGDFGNDRLYGGDGDDFIDSGDGADLVDGGAGDDTIYGFGSGTEIGGFDQLVGGYGNDIIYGGEGIDKLSGGAGDDILYGEGNTDPFTRGGDGNDYVDGGNGGDLLYGDDGDDLVVGGNDQDQLFGGTGDDILRPGRPSQAIGFGPDEVIGDDGFTNTGFDLMDYSDWDAAPTGVLADLENQANPLQAIDGTLPGPAWFQIEGMIGTRNNDTLVGDSAVIGVEGGSGNNWLIGGSGNDVMTGNGGNDVIIGGSIRLDSLIGRYESTPGVASMYATDEYTGASNRVAATDALSQGVLGAVGFDKHFTEMLKSDMFKNQMLGDGGADTLASDTAVFTGNLADYTVRRVFYTSADEGIITAYRVTDTRDPTAVDAAGVLIPTDGVDIVVGVEQFRFADVTVSAADLMSPPPTDIQWRAVTPGNNGLPAANTVIASLTSTDGDATPGAFLYALEAGGSANFTVSAAGIITRTGADMAANTTYTLQISSTDSVFGGKRSETFTIRTGDVNNGDAIAAGNATDHIVYGSGGNDILTGAGGADTLLGQAGNDTLSGGDGNDTLNGGSGTNALRGGAGDDLYMVTSVFDTVDERNYAPAVVNGSDAGGTDTVSSSISYTLAAHTLLGANSRGAIENLTLTGAVNINGTGNALANVITGNDGSNTLNGGLGADIMAGGVGNDTYEVDNIGDVVIEATGQGTDVVRTTLTTYTLGDNIENLAYTAALNFTGNGNALANIIVGGAGINTLADGDGNDTLHGQGANDFLYGEIGADTLNGGAGADLLDGGIGADTLNGGGGNDRYIVDDAGDNVNENAGAGTDTAQTALATFDLNLATNVNVENLTYTGSVSFIGQGNGGLNVLVGGSQNDTLRGLGGNDTLIGGGGNDSLNGGTGNDVFVFGAGFGHDTIVNAGGTGFDANATGGQDILDISALGITSTTFAASVSIADLGVDTRATIGADSILLQGVNGIGANAITIADFLLAA